MYDVTTTYQILDLLIYCAAHIFSYRRFETTYRLHLEDTTDRLFQDVGNYQCTPRDIPEERKSHLNLGESLKSRVACFSVHTNFVYDKVHCRYHTSDSA
jgi:hypothetical protein